MIQFKTLNCVSILKFYGGYGYKYTPVQKIKGSKKINYDEMGFLSDDLNKKMDETT